MTPPKKETPCLEHEKRISTNEADIKNQRYDFIKMEKTITKTFWLVVTTLLAVVVRYLPSILNYITKNVEAINK